MFAQTSEPTDSSTSSDSNDLISKLGSDIEVTVDRWSAGQVGLSDLAVAFGVMVAAGAAGWLVRRLFARAAARSEGVVSTAALLGGQLLSIAIYLFAMGLVLEVLGFSLGPVIILVLVVLVGVLFLQPLIFNLSAGLLLQLRGPFAPGDTIEALDVTGVVEEVNARTVIIATNDGRTAHLPNRQVLTSRLVNLTSQGRRRSCLTVYLPGPEGLSATSDELRAAVAGVDGVLADPAPDVLVEGFDGSRVSALARFWHAPDERSARLARDGVGRALADWLVSSGVQLGDPVLVMQHDGPEPGAA